MGMSAFLPIEDHASLLLVYLVSSQGEFASSNFWLDICYCATLLAMVVSFQFFQFVSRLCVCRTLPTLHPLVCYVLIAPNNFLGTLFFHSLCCVCSCAFPIHTRIYATCFVISARPQLCFWASVSFAVHRFAWCTYISDMFTSCVCVAIVTANLV